MGRTAKTTKTDKKPGTKAKADRKSGTKTLTKSQTTATSHSKFAKAPYVVPKATGSQILKRAGVTKQEERQGRSVVHS